MIADVKKMIPKPIKRDTRRLLVGVGDSLRYRRMKKPETTNLRHVTFVCEGNICRSPFAEKALLRRLNGNQVQVESCGLQVLSGMSPPDEAIEAAATFGVDLSLHRARSAEESNMLHADLVVAMEYGQLLRLADRWPQLRKRLVLLRPFAPWPLSMLCNIDDPYGCEPQIYHRCFTTIGQALDALAAR
jgi:protein-tyrosine phosphatase